MSEQNFYRAFDGMCWPAKSARLGDVVWSLSWSDPPSKTDCLLAASVLTAYAELISMPVKRRNALIRELRKGPGIIRAAEIGRNKEQDGGGV